MNIIDRSFAELTAEIRALGEKELYYRIRRGFDCREPAEALCRRCHYASRFNIPLPQSNKK